MINFIMSFKFYIFCFLVGWITLPTILFLTENRPFSTLDVTGALVATFALLASFLAEKLNK